MKQSEIVVGHTYRNRGKGTTQRKVMGIGPEYRPVSWLGKWESRPPADAPGVEFEQDGDVHRLHLFAFAAWAGSEVSDD